MRGLQARPEQRLSTAFDLDTSAGRGEDAHIGKMTSKVHSLILESLLYFHTKSPVV